MPYGESLSREDELRRLNENNEFGKHVAAGIAHGQGYRRGFKRGMLQGALYGAVLGATLTLLAYQSCHAQPKLNASTPSPLEQIAQQHTP